MRNILTKAGILVLLFLMLLPAVPVAAGRHKADQAAKPKARILFVPQDNRPTSCEQTADVVRKLGYEVVMPDKELLGGLKKRGNPERLWQWTKEQAPKADIAVIATDSLLYGGLVASRKHNTPLPVLQERAGRLAELHRDNPGLKLYAFASLMRTPRSGEASGGEDPDYYIDYGAKIFRYTGLMDKAEMRGLSAAEADEAMELESAIPDWVLADWMKRRQHNVDTTKMLIDDVRAGAMEYLLVGKDDNASLSQTHRESRWLKTYAEGIPAEHFQLVAGIDELGLLLMSRAANAWEHVVPQVAIRYNEGMGGRTIPTYSDERVEATLQTDLQIAGGRLVAEPAKADFTLLVNTNPDGVTGEANHIRDWEQAPLNNGQDRAGTNAFLRQLRELLHKGYAVGVADIAFTNGADNALMRHLEQENLLFSLRSYAGWNTATNSLGFSLAQGMLAARMPKAAANALLLTRYLDDWGYQANVRTALAMEIEQLEDPQVYLYLGDYEPYMVEQSTALLQAFAREHLPQLHRPETLQVTFPWQRMFIADIRYDAQN
ncbi:Protein of unknown function [Selenomonas ruminantium]|uniref:DUF4127 family protein n=1 Tax=Selenomonas ruminantium TaxID=971 RepID=A0A1I3FDR3_SELRU|nr:DUF4127 family protein [Selenomonas ruminantium]SFI09327.1 Protein of unknown function [Selenomonas ruminantium]